MNFGILAIAFYLVGLTIWVIGAFSSLRKQVEIALMKEAIERIKGQTNCANQRTANLSATLGEDAASDA